MAQSYLHDLPHILCCYTTPCMLPLHHLLLGQMSSNFWCQPLHSDTNRYIMRTAPPLSMMVNSGIPMQIRSEDGFHDTGGVKAIPILWLNDGLKCSVICGAHCEHCCCKYTGQGIIWVHCLDVECSDDVSDCLMRTRSIIDLACGFRVRIAFIFRL